MTAKYVSNIKKINSPVEKVFTFLSDFENLSPLFEQVVQKADNQQHNITDKIEVINISNENCTINIQDYGTIELQIVNKEPFKMIKYTGGNNTSFPFYFWVQLVEKSPIDTRIRLTMHAQINYIMRMMIDKKLKKGLNQLAEAMTKFPY